MKKGKIIAIVTAAAIAVGGGITFFALNGSDKDPVKSRKDKDSSGVTSVSDEKTFDENNVGEIYCAPIDPDHIAEDECGMMYADNELLVVAQKGVTKDQIADLAEEYDAEIVGYIEQTGDYQWKMSSALKAEKISDIIDKLKKNDKISDCCLNYIYDYETDAGPEEQVITYGSKWSAYLSDATDTNGRSWGAELINAPAAWSYMESRKVDIKPVRVGLVDSGFNESHEDLSFAENGIFYQNERNAVPDYASDKERYEATHHGTHTAGTFAAVGTNDAGINGIYPYSEGRLYAVSRSNAVRHAENGSCFQSCMTDKIAFSELIFRNVKVINLSMNNERARVDQIVNKKSDWEDALNNLNKNSKILGDYFERLIKQGYDFVIVSAAGNGSTAATGNMESQYNSYINNITNDTVKDRIIVVGSVGQESSPHYDSKLKFEYYDIKGKYDISSFSNAGNRVDIFAPGYDVYSCYSSVFYDESNKKYYSASAGEQYWYLSGTSMAAPHVAGVCADVWSVNNKLTGEQVKSIVTKSVLVNTNCPLMDGVNNENLAEKVKESGYRGVYKYPIVDCNEAVRTAFSTKGLSKNSGENYGAALGWVVERGPEDPPADSSSKKIADVTLEVYTNSAEHKRVTVDDVKEWKTDDHGHFEILLPEGDYLIEAHKSGYKEKTGDHSVAASVRSNEITYTEWIELESESSEPPDAAVVRKSYQEILDSIRDELSSDMTEWKKDKYGSDPDSVGYMLKDLNGDGIDELIIGLISIGENWDYEKNRIIELYTYKNGNAERILFSWWNRNEFFLVCGNKILNHQAGTEGLHIYSLLEFSPDMVDGNKEYACYISAMAGEYQYNGADGSNRSITRDEFDSVKAEWTQLAEFTLTPIISSSGGSGSDNPGSPPDDSVEFAGHRYKVFLNPEEYDVYQSKAACEELGGHLVSINSQEEQNFIVSLLGEKDNYWIGLERDSSGWRWMDGSSFSYSNWDYWIDADGERFSQPDNYEGREFSCRIAGNTVEYEDWYMNKGGWIDTDGSGKGEDLSTYGYICEWDS